MKDHAHDWAYPCSTRWEKTRALFDPTIYIPEHVLEATDSLGNVAKRVFVSRAWIPNFDNGAAGWKKKYAKAGYDLRAFNTAERNMLESLGKVPNCYKLVDNYSHATKLNSEKHAYITMTDMGPTVYDWQHWPVRVGVERKRFANIFELPGNFVRLALAGLTSLSEIHDRGFVHMDYRMPNVCLATRGAPILCQDKGGGYLKIQLDWSSLKAIDFGFSIARGQTPHTLLPLLEGATPAAKALITRVEEMGRQRFSAFSPAERNEFKAAQFSDVEYDHNFWTTRCEDALDQLRAIDWREDCYQFGKQLQAICAQPGLAAFLKQFTFTDEDEGDIDKVRPPGWVALAFKKLPEQLIALGQSVTAYPARGSAEAAELEQERKDTYRRLMRELEIAIRDMPLDWSTDEVLILQSDIVEPHAGSAPQHTAVRPPVRSFPWKKTAAAVAGSAALLAALPSLQAWTKTTRPPEPVAVMDPPAQPAASPAPPPKPRPTPEELAARRAAEEVASDPAAACWKNGAWEAACGFAAYAGGPVFRVVGGNLSFGMGTRKGSDSMAVDDETPPHEVSFQRRYALAETEVTVAHYLACVQDGGCKEPEWREAGSQYHYQTGSNTYYRDTNALQADSPITGVSWANAKAYVAWLSRKTGQTFTLPTEAQWEYAARGGQTGRWYFGDNESQLKDHAWYSDNAGGKLHPVGSTRLSAHPWGLKDMAGNAWEWVEDCWHGNYTNAPSSGDKAWEGANGGECGLRVVRGGSWINDARYSRAAFRIRFSTGIRNNYLSFRPARMLP